MATTPNLGLPVMASGQAQKHVTFNAAVDAIDAILQGAVLSRNQVVPPAEPAEGDRYLLAQTPQDAFEGQGGMLAVWEAASWRYHTPRVGWTFWVVDEALHVVRRDDGTWSTLPVDSALLLGVNTTADAQNRLSVRSKASLFTHEGDDHRMAINKAAAGDTASLIWQTGFSGRAELGLAGNDAFSLKTSPDGVQWTTRLSMPIDSEAMISNGHYSGQATIAADGVVEITPPDSSGFFFLQLYEPDFPQIGYSAVFVYDAGNSPALLDVFTGWGAENWGAQELTGSTGTTNKINVSVAVNKLQLENRRAMSAIYRYVFIG